MQWSSLTGILHNLDNFLPNMPVSQKERLRKRLEENFFLILVCSYTYSKHTLQDVYLTE